MRRLLLGVCLLLLASCGGASPNITNPGSHATSTPTSTPTPIPACHVYTSNHQLNEPVTGVNWQITLVNEGRQLDPPYFTLMFTFKNTTSNEVSVGTGSTEDPYFFSFDLHDSNLNRVPGSIVLASPTSVPAGQVAQFILAYQVNDAIVKGYHLLVASASNPPGCTYGEWDINES